MDQFIRLFGKSSIESLVRDREFVGEKWLEYLNKEGIPYYLTYTRELIGKRPVYREAIQGFLGLWSIAIKTKHGSPTDLLCQ